MNGGGGPVFSPEQGLLRLPRHGLRALAAHHRRRAGRPLPPGEAKASRLLEELGVVGTGGVYPLLEAVADTVAHPLVRLRLQVGRPAPPLTVLGWVAPGWGVFTLPVQDASRELWDVVQVHPTRVPGVLATVIGLGPRPGPSLWGSVVLPTEAARSLAFAEDGLDPQAVLRAAGVDEPWRGALAHLAGAVARTWAAGARWPRGDEVVGRQLRVVDGGGVGLWLWTDATIEGRALTRLAPATSSSVWRRLTALLPDADDFRPGVGGDAPG